MYIIGIAGGSGSGKTTFADKIAKRFSSKEVVLLHQDNYYLARQPRDNFLEGSPNFDSPQAFDWELLRRHIALLKKNKTVKSPLYDFKTSSRQKATRKIGPCKVVIIEGLLTLWDEALRNLFDLKIYLKVESDVRFIRRLHRDISERGRSLEDIIGQYYRTVRPMHLKYTQPTQQYADLIVGEHHDTAVDVLCHEIAMRLKA